jgi:hypothetical protein
MSEAQIVFHSNWQRSVNANMVRFSLVMLAKVGHTNLLALIVIQD